MARPKKNDPVALVCTLAVILAVTAVTSLFLLLNAREEPAAAWGEPLEAPWAEGAREGRLPGIDGPEGDEDTFRYQLNGTPTFSASGREGNLLIENTPGNRYPMEVLYQLDETGETVCESGLLPPGSCLETGRLNTELEPGEYAARAVIVVYDRLDGEELARFEEGIALLVQP